MTKKLLLAATAMSVIGFAGAANAQVVSFAEVSNVTVKPDAATAAKPYAIANESIASVANRRTATAADANHVRFTTNLVGAAPGAPAKLAAGTSYRITYTLSGSANPTFIAQVTSAAISGVAASDNDCIANRSIVAGTGAGGSNSVSFIVTTVAATNASCTVAAGMTTAEALQLDVPFTIGALGTVSATVSGSLDASNTNPAATNPYAGGTAASVSLVQALQGYRIFADATVDNASEGAAAPDNADFPTQLALATSGAPFRTFVTGASNDAVIGAAGFIAAPIPAGITAAGDAVHANLAAAPLPAPTYALTITPTNGDFSVLKPQAQTADNGALTDAVVAANNLSATVGGTGAAALSGARNIALRIEGAPTASIASAPLTYTVNVTPVAPAANDSLVTRPAALTNQALETVGLQGSTFIAPWVQSANPNYNTVIRISNNGGGDTGSVQLALASPLNTPTASVCTAAQLPKLASIPANGELALNSADLTTCFGAFGRGDVSATVLSLNTNLTAKLRIVSPGNIVSEQSLGRF